MDEKQLKEIIERVDRAYEKTHPYHASIEWNAFMNHAKDDIHNLIDEIERIRAENNELRERLSTIYGLAYDYDGYDTSENLKRLIDVIAEIATGEGGNNEHTQTAG